MTEQIIVEPTDRTGWPAGPWDTESDREEWRDETTGLVCIARRNPMGAWCGYVAVPPGHPWHGLDYDSAPAQVHGGLTYASRCCLENAVCHVPAEGEPVDVWWLGFDCNHAFDLAPYMLAQGFPPIVDPLLGNETYKDLGYVRSEVRHLASQVAAAAP